MPRIMLLLPTAILAMVALAAVANSTGTTGDVGRSESASSADSGESRRDVPQMTDQPVGVGYSLNQVRQWAADHSPEGNLLDSEAKAIRCNVDPHDEESRCSAALMSSVLTELALGRRADDAELAAKAYHQWIAATEGLAVARAALVTHDELVSLAEKAEELEIPDGDVLKLRQEHFVLLDAETQQRFAIPKLRQELSRLTGRPESEAATAFPIENLPESAAPIDASTAVVAAIAQRHDLRAIGNLCQKMNTCSLPAARQLLAAINPGVGLSLAAAAGGGGGGGLLGCLKKDDDTQDLAARKRQCVEIRESLEGQIRNETLQAVLDIRLAAARVEIAIAQWDVARTRVADAKDRIGIAQAPPGTDLVIELEAARLRGEVIRRKLDLALAIDELAHVQNEPIPTP